MNERVNGRAGERAPCRNTCSQVPWQPMPPCLQLAQPPPPLHGLKPCAAATAIEPGVIQVGEGAFAYAGCSDPAAVISEIVLPAYGNPQLGCNSSLSYV